MSKDTQENVALSTNKASGVLVGRIDHSLDPKKRLTIPSEWRNLLGGCGYAYIMPDPREKCLNLVPSDEMEARLIKLREKALFDRSIAKALQVIGANSEQVAFDVQGRIRISDKFLQFAELSSQVAMIGSIRMIKLWNPGKLDAPDGVDQTGLESALDQVGF